jgi:hypothetical protein
MNLPRRGGMKIVFPATRVAGACTKLTGFTAKLRGLHMFVTHMGQILFSSEY